MVRNVPPYPLKSNSIYNKNDRIYNVDKWGCDKDHNILFITGLSGSGKSTTAKNISIDTNSVLVDLDAYYGEATRKTNKNLDEYLGKKYPEYKTANNELLKNDATEYFRIKDNMIKHMVEYSKYIYPKRMIIEGVEIFNGTILPEITFNQAVYIIGTDMNVSKERAIKRMVEMGESIHAIQEYKNPESELGKRFIDDYIYNERLLKEFENGLKRIAGYA